MTHQSEKSDAAGLFATATALREQSRSLIRRAKAAIHRRDTIRAWANEAVGPVARQVLADRIGVIDGHLRADLTLLTDGQAERAWRLIEERGTLERRIRDLTPSWPWVEWLSALARAAEVAADADRLCLGLLDTLSRTGPAEDYDVVLELVMFYGQAFAAVYHALPDSPSGIRAAKVFRECARGLAAHRLWLNSATALNPQKECARMARHWRRIVELLTTEKEP